MSRLDDIKARIAAATPGPWVIDPNQPRGSGYSPYGIAVYGSLEGRPCGYLLEVDEQKAGPHPNADLIAHAPADLALLLEIAEAAANLDRYEDFGDNIPCHSCWPIGADGKAEFKRARKRLYDALKATAPEVIGIPGPGSHGEIPQ